MIDTNKLRGLIVERGMSQHKMAYTLGMTDKTFYSKMKKGVFDSDEIMQMISFLKIDDPISIFFIDDGTLQVPTNAAANRHTA